MHITTRYLIPSIKEDLKEKMVFVGGPRQVGKTTMAKQLMAKNSQSIYLNWDSLEDRSKILKHQFSLNQSLIAFDEVHKYRLWRTLLKGIYDKYFPDINCLVTGSARLDYFHKGGDSLLGRYHYYRLHPLTLPELNSSKKSDSEQLLHFGGFPEPFFKANSRHRKRWNLERSSRLVTEDLSDLEKVKDLSLIELLVSLLPERVGSPLSIKSLSEDLQVSPHTVDRWIMILENLYFCYRIYPYNKGNRARAVKKTAKLFLWDWSAIDELGPKFENMVAGHLLKYCHYQQDYEGDKMELCYIRDVDHKEVDFLVTKNGLPLFAVECKSGERSLSQALSFFQLKYKIPKVYQVHMQTKDYGHPANGGRVIPFNQLCIELNLK